MFTKSARFYDAIYAFKDYESDIEFHYLVGTPDGFSYFTERHETGLFTHDEYLDAFRAVGLTADFDPDGIYGTRALPCNRTRGRSPTDEVNERDTSEATDRR